MADERICLIVDQVSDRLVTSLSRLRTVEAFFHCALDKEHRLDEVKLACEQMNQQALVFSTLNEKEEKRDMSTKSDLTHEIGSFLFFQLFKMAFKNLPKNTESKRLFIERCRAYYQGNAQVQEDLSNFERNYKSSDALRWYVQHSFIYRLINKAFRTENITALHHLHFFIVDLSAQLEKEFSQFLKGNRNGSLQLYLAFNSTREQVKQFEENIGNLILNNGYLSVTRHRQLALDSIASLNITQSNRCKVLFEFTVDLTVTKTLVLADNSASPALIGPNEILFDLGQLTSVRCVLTISFV